MHFFNFYDNINFDYMILVIIELRTEHLIMTNKRVIECLTYNWCFSIPF